MEELGKKLRQRRLEKNVSLSTIAQETYIAQHYLESIEEEDFDNFPATSYLLGFLKIYAKYLDFDPDEIIELYHQTILQEQPAPTVDLWKVKKNPPLQMRSIFLLLALLFVVLAIATLLIMRSQNLLPFLMPSEAPSRTEEAAEAAEAAAAAEAETGQSSAGEEEAIPTLQDAISDFGLIEQEFSLAHSFEILINDEIHLLSLQELEDEIHIVYDDASAHLIPNEEVMIDINKDGEFDLSLTLRSIDPEKQTVILRISKSIHLPEHQNRQENIVADGGEYVVIRRQASITPFDVDIAFRNATFFRAIHDKEYVERVMNRNDAYQADNLQSIEIALSNRSAADIRIAGEELALQDADDPVLVLQLAWQRRRNAYQLELRHLD